MDIIAIFSLIIIVLALIVVFLYYQNNKIDVTEYEIETDKLSGNVKLLQLSDLHSKPFKAAYDKTAEIKPDIILITGDYINDKEKRLDEMLKYGRKLCSVAPVYYICGNHERRLESFDSVMQKLKEIGFCVLLNETTDIKINNNNVAVLGLDENQANFEDYKARKNGTFKYKDVSNYFEELNEHNGFKIVLSHYPENFEGVKEMNYGQYDFDLQLSGHAHGGQFILPFIGPVFSPGQGIMPKYAKGSFGKRPKLIVSRGLGNAEFPFRLFNHPEINVINLKGTK